MVQQLRALAALVDSQGSVPRTHKWLTSFRISNDLFWPQRARGTHTVCKTHLKKKS